MQVIGLCRFSYPAIGGFQVRHESIGERIAYLYSETRLEGRFRTFETMTLPSIRAQTDPDFTFVIVIGESLPERYRVRLEALVADVPQVVIDVRKPDRHRPVMQDAVNSVRREGTGPSVQFRLDDDDAVGVRFVESLRELVNDTGGLVDRGGRYAIDFPQGFIARPGPAGLDAAPVKRTLMTAGLAIVLHHDDPMTVMNFSHNQLAARMPVLTVPGEDMLVRGHNDFNDSRQKARVKPALLQRLDAAGEEYFRETFAIDADQVRRVFSAS